MATKAEEALAAQFAELEAEFETKRAAAHATKLRDGRFDPDLLAERDEVMQRLGDLRTYWKQIGEAQQNGAPGKRVPGVNVSNFDGSVEA